MCLFVRDLLPGFPTDPYQIAHRHTMGARGWPRENGILKFQIVSMETGKFSHASLIGSIGLNFRMCIRLDHINLPAKNEEDWPSRFGDRPLTSKDQLTVSVTMERGSCLDGVMSLMRARDVISRVTSHATSWWRQTDQRRSPEHGKFWILQIGQLLREIRPFSWMHVTSLWS